MDRIAKNANPLPRPVHGGIKPAELRALGLRPEDCLDFSASVSPLGPPDGVTEAMAGVDLAAYPDPHCLALTEAIAAHHAADGVAVENVIVGNGSTEIIHLLTRAYIESPPSDCSRSALCLTPTYGEYDGAVRISGGEVHTLTATRNENGFTWDITAAIAEIDARRPALLFVCNPNNPTGALLAAAELERLAEAAASVGCLLVVDEAYINLSERYAGGGSVSDGGATYLGRCPALNDERLRPHRLAAGLCRRQPAGHRQAGGAATGLERQRVGPGRRRSGPCGCGLSAPRAGRRRRVAALRGSWPGRFGYPLLSRCGQLVLAQVGDASGLRDRMARRGLFVRDCASFGLPDCIRIGLRPVADCIRLIDAIAEVTNSGSKPAPHSMRGPK